MTLLVYFLRFFSWIFGITEATRKDEKKYALLLVGTLLATAMLVACAVWVLFQVMM